MCWLKEYLTNRLQSVCINNVQSTFLNVTSGVPQDSVLGPLLFNIYINDLVDVCPPITFLSDVYLYADDAKLFSSDKIELQVNINKVESFTKNRQLSLAPAKCQYLPIKRKGSANNDYFLGDCAIPCTSSVNMRVTTVNMRTSSLNKLLCVRPLSSLLRYMLKACVAQMLLKKSQFNVEKFLRAIGARGGGGHGAMAPLAL